MMISLGSCLVKRTAKAGLDPVTFGVTAQLGVEELSRLLVVVVFKVK